MLAGAVVVVSYFILKVKVTQSCPTLCDTHELCSPWNSPGQNTGVGNRSLLQGIFSTQRSNPGLPHRRWILYQLSHQGSPWILEWVAYPFSRGSSWPSDRTGVSCTAGRFFTSWATREAHFSLFLIWIISILSFFFVSFARGLSWSFKRISFLFHLFSPLFLLFSVLLISVFIFIISLLLLVLSL